MSEKKSFVVDENTRKKQTTASNPKNTIWVSANAGSGKTHVLSERVIRLLLMGVAPAKILCLTYTKTASAEMINRVFERLSQWVALDDAALSSAMYDLEEAVPSAARLRTARNLFARALETPGGLQIQTIHAFCTTILKRFPLEANIIGHFELLDNETDALFRQEAKRRVTIKAHQGIDEALSRAYELALDSAGEGGLGTLFDAALSGPERSALQTFLKLRDDDRLQSDFLHRHFDFEQGETTAKILADAWPMGSLSIERIKVIIADAPRSKGSTVREFGQVLEYVLSEADPALRFNTFAREFLTKDHEAKKPRNYQSIAPDFAEIFVATAQEILDIRDRLAKHKMVDLANAAHVLLAHITTIHTAMKRDGGFLDYEDLIEATHRLLSRDHASAWVQYKLDQGIDHVLVDEAQDTSPRQWDIINTLTSDFFAGETAATSERTLFVVGDEKQSIYSFQGARPEVFADTGRGKAQLLAQVNRPFELIRFSLSFRSTPEILQAVDYVFESEAAAKGLATDGEPIVHQSIRQKEHGVVEVWDLITPDHAEEVEDWTKGVDHAKAPEVKLASEIAKTIKSLVSDQKNPATGKLIKAGDILVLVRKRDKFMHALSKELKDLNVPVAGADRLVLTSHIAILDLMAAARITLQPDDDLSLAALLRSPVFGLSDDALTDLASQRRGIISLFDQLKLHAQSSETLKSIYDDLQRWRNEADFVPVYEFFARILGRDGARAKLIARLGEEASDIIDEFLSYALASEKSGLIGLQSFVETLARAAPEIKRQSGGERDEVRIMTVHGAKGLEAPYVFLIDPGSNPTSSQHKAPLVSMPFNLGNQDHALFIWLPKKEFANSATKIQDEKRTALQLAEYRRLLYVGMTRAKDVLVVCGFRGKIQSKEPTWVDIVRTGLSGRDGTVEKDHPITARQTTYFKLGTTEPKQDSKEQEQVAMTSAVPPWLTSKLPAIILPPRPLTPSGLGLAIDGQAEPSKLSPVLDLAQDLPNAALERGSAVHRLLEVLPTLPRHDRATAAQRYLQRKIPDINHDILISKINELLDDPRFEIVFSHQSRAEVSVGGTLILNGEARSISGKIDRLAVTDTHVLIVDYKTNRPPPRKLNDVPESHIAQLALYRAILTPLYPNRTIEAALIYTEGPHFITIGVAQLNAALEALTAS